MVVKSKYFKGKARPNYLSVDPTRTGMLRASFSREIRKRFAKLRLHITDLIVTQDVLGLVESSPVGNAFCPTGSGGGIDPHCSPSREGASKKIPSVKELASRIAALKEKEFYRVGTVIAWTDFEKETAGLYRPPKPLAVPRQTWWVQMEGGGVQFSKSPEAAAKKMRELIKYDIENPTTNALWSNRTIVEKVRAFQLWLRSQLREIILGVSEDNLWDKYITEGFRKGAGRSFDDVKKAKVIPKEELAYEMSKSTFLDSAFHQPNARQKLELLVSRTFTEMQGITETMATQMTRALTDGLTKGKSTKQIASDLVAVSDLSRARAETIARTEIIRSFSEGQLDALENLGVEEVGVAVEWSVTKTRDGQIEQRVCKLCRPLDGVVLKIAEARGMLPRHPS